MLVDSGDIHTESDVEQKLILPLLTTQRPQGLGFTWSDFRTKGDIRKLTIDKGNKTKLYYPDYAVILSGLPILIIEAKAPGEDIAEGFREARLYATEVNAKFPAKINPCCKIVSINGDQIFAGSWDQDDPLISLSTANLDALSPAFNDFLDFASKETAQNIADEIRSSLRQNAHYTKPVRMLGGQGVANQSVGENSFGANVSLEYKYLFNPDKTEDRDAIAQNAYVPSKRKLSHVSPIDKIIRGALPRGSTEARAIRDTSSPDELFDPIRHSKYVRHEICLLVGGVGSGKSTFVDYLRLVSLPDDLRHSTAWIHINLNNAPVSRDLIYDWVLREARDRVADQNPEVDFDELSTLRTIYSRPLSNFMKGPISLYPEGSDRYTDLFYEEMRRLQQDQGVTFQCILDHFYGDRGLLPIIVLDNCDKRVRDDQLLMFEVASWLKEKFPCSIFLPIRDTTYDNYCDEPPLDTVIKDLVFRIDPPLLERVVYARLNYALREIENSNDKFVYYLSNNAKVECQRKEVSYYLKCIVSSLFQDHLFKSIITGLAGRNIRKGLEIFLDFCKSGHIEENEIFRIRQSHGDHRLPKHLVTRVLMKGKRRYYSDRGSFIKSMFQSEASDHLPDPFVRLDILQWLKRHAREYGPNRTKGFHKVKELIRFLQAYGHEYNVIQRELTELSNAGCVLTESLSGEIDDEDLVSIASGGHIHLDLMRHITYLSNIAEDTYFRNSDMAKRIADNLLGTGHFARDSREAAIDSAAVLTEYMSGYQAEYFFGSTQVLNDDGRKELFDVDQLNQFVTGIRDNNTQYQAMIAIEETYPPGTVIDGQITSVKPYGVFVEFGLSAVGLVHNKELGLSAHEIVENIDEGDYVEVEIIRYNPEHRKFELRMRTIRK